MKGVSVFTQETKCSLLASHIVCGQPEIDPYWIL